MMIYGRRWTKVADIVGTRNTVQVRSHAQKYEMKMEKHSGSGQAECASEGDHSNDLDANSWAGVVEAPAAHGHGHGNAMMAFEHEGMHAGHQLQTSTMMENMMQANMSNGSPEEEMAQWAELAVGAPQSQVSDATHYKAWNELPNAGQMHNQPMGHQPLPHRIDTSYDSYGAMITGTTPTASKPASPSSSEDEFMTYLDSNSMEMAMGDDMYSMNMGASDLAPPPMFPEFPSGDSYNGGW
mmetsp:Transcript_14518/g.25466  ORF Transcript_14518/g.25466 Transcript_14518/m.25466 type:complete len:240 (+) Transcript_14518:464-1183(+)